MYYSKLFPHIQWQHSELQDRKVDSIRYYKDADPREKYENVAEPLKIDICDPVDCWGLKHDTFDFMFNSKMVHILPWKGTVSLFANAGYLCCNEQAIPNLVWFPKLKRIKEVARIHPTISLFVF